MDEGLAISCFLNGRQTKAANSIYALVTKIVTLNHFVNIGSHIFLLKETHHLLLKQMVCHAKGGYTIYSIKSLHRVNAFQITRISRFYYCPMCLTYTVCVCRNFAPGTHARRRLFVINLVIRHAIGHTVPPCTGIVAKHQTQGYRNGFLFLAGFFLFLPIFLISFVKLYLIFPPNLSIK